MSKRFPILRTRDSVSARGPNNREVLPNGDFTWLTGPVDVSGNRTKAKVARLVSQEQAGVEVTSDPSLHEELRAITLCDISYAAQCLFNRGRQAYAEIVPRGWILRFHSLLSFRS
jgi:hypothetical protein